MKTSHKRQSIVRHEGGFSILEVLVAGAIGIVVAFAIAQTSINATHAEKSSALDLEYVALISRLQNAVDDPVICPSLWQTWNGSAFVATVFDPTTGPPAVADIDLIQDGALTDIARTAGLTGAPTIGLTFPSSASLRMQFSEPYQVGDNIYNWTFRIVAEKKATAGVNLPGSPFIQKRFRLEISTNGSPNYNAIYCGPPTSPAANQQIPLFRFTATSSNCNNTDAQKDTSCSTEFGQLYVAAGLQDMVGFRMFYSVPGSSYADVFRFSVARNNNAFSNSHLGSGGRAAGTIFIVSDTGTCQVACIRNTAPLRFTRDFFANSVASKTQLCQEHVGFNYVAASPNDLIRYGFKSGNNQVFPVDNSAPGAVFDGGSIGCMMGWPSLASGPLLDCGAGASALSFPLACVLK